MVFFEISINYGECTDLENVLIGEGMDSFIQDFNRKNDGNIYIIYDRNSNKENNNDLLYVVFLAGKADYNSWFYNEFVKGCGITNLSYVSFSEMTLQLFVKRVEAFDKNILIKLGLIHYQNNNQVITEYMHPYKPMNKRKAKKILFDNMCSACCEEIDRIFSHGHKKIAMINPVQYIVKASTHKTSKIIRETLLSSLFATGRISSLRVTDMVPSFYDSEIEDNHSTPVKEPQRDYFGEYVLQDGATVSIHKFKTIGMDVDLVTDCINMTHRDVLTIIDVDRNEDILIQEIIAKCPEVKFVILSDDIVSADKAATFLAKIAKEKNIDKNDLNIGEMLDQNAVYSASDLYDMFDGYLSKKYLDKYYPEYSSLPVNKRNVIEPIGNAYRELEELIGLDKVKELIKSIVAFCTIQKERTENGLPAVIGCKHMVFSGNPGTAKTTVARLVAKILKDNNVLSTGKIVEVGRADLVGKYVGHTAPKVKAAFEKAKGSLLFIDEAYSLLDEEGSFGYEAINTLVQEMENHKDDVIVILAGYLDKMKQFINSNPGLRSRIAFNVQFDDYSTDQLISILKLFTQRTGYELEEDSLKKVREVIEKAKQEKHFGNGRYIRNLFERAVMNQNTRLLNESNNCTELKNTLSAQDFTYQEDDVVIRHFGF